MSEISLKLCINSEHYVHIQHERILVLSLWMFRDKEKSSSVIYKWKKLTMCAEEGKIPHSENDNFLLRNIFSILLMHIL